MTRAKTRPSMHKPAFDADSILRFAALETPATGHDLRAAGGDPDRTSVTLMLKTEVVARIKAEAARKGKSAEQIVEKLVTKHLGKH
jgi:hypothetical protein